MESLQVIESSFVAPKEATPTKGLWLSPVDLAATRGHTTLVFFYPSGAAFFDAARLKEAMAKALVAFYPLASRLGFDNDGRLEISCNELPCHDRTLLRARSPPVVHPDALSVLHPKVTLSQSSSRPNATEVFPISRDQLVTLKRLCGGASTFCSVSALVWKCAGIARRLPPDTIARLSFPVNVRRRGVLKPPLPARYFGNALVSLCVAGAARDIASEALASVAARINGALARMDDDLVRSAIDYLELADKDIRPQRGSLPETELRIVSWLSLPGHDADFGCGAPQVMSRAESVRGGFVHIMNDAPEKHRGGSAVRVLVCMEATNMKEFQRQLYANIAKQASKL
ncbi:unnamed protein product [Miscanthus lutarioriparius]|uniref:Uncharacterized protein n=1 Tax=Miscanthus lutarioriparius TaxID=422564 RepID=A0A811NDK3_9POAL|nr:unnamed protein product [Miscanthus lutarioriparius]